MDYGTQEGDRCGRLNEEDFICDGEMFFPPVANCSCHIAPPCGNCTDNPLQCSVCGALPEDVG